MPDAGMIAPESLKQSLPYEIIMIIPYTEKPCQVILVIF
ncbi:hypothetical protein SB48_HM08orf02436 [Heyndrickxia coagulans]|uniref:Uncharacterized protein n=1 Tax=Heyndrickxia coagulans TaxID=1398 RepID=A0AAN0T5U7_HEYCO|nr:hypothetical protein SB48_HM08orf02436 [Heyndrickxia coagulans]